MINNVRQWLTKEHVWKIALVVVFVVIDIALVCLIAQYHMQTREDHMTVNQDFESVGENYVSDEMHVTDEDAVVDLSE